MVHGHGTDEIPFIATPSDKPGFGTLLRREPGVSVLYVRYNSGLHISENGRALSALLDELMDAHGDGIRRLILVGHSMGGLVVRSAGFYGGPDGAWTRKLTTVLLIGTPMMGSFIEQFANLSAAVLKTIVNFHTRLIGQIIDERSNGIKDLRHGTLVDQDWERPHRRTPVPLIPGVDYHVLAGTLSENDGSPLALFFGDGMVGRQSATGQGLVAEDDPIAGHCTCHVFPKSSHYDTVFSPEIGATVVDIVRRAVEAKAM
jgi:pimeloyl-ACP methyl ester carboxylesterase